MKTFIYNVGYFFREARTIFNVDMGSNVFSIFSVGFILFILSMIFSGWLITSDIVEVLKSEAEISVFYEEDIKLIQVNSIKEKIKNINGVNSVDLISEGESYDRMVGILGEEAGILNLFEDNPFTSFIEVSIDIENAEEILGEVENIEEVKYIRDNKEIIEKLQNIITILTILGALIVTTVGITTIFVVSHIIRQGIYNNRDQIRTLKLLGAPDSFIGAPFVLEGLYLTLGGGAVASILISGLLYFGYGQIGKSILFIPLPAVASLISYMLIGILSISAVLGILGSLFGLKSIKSS